MKIEDLQEAITKVEDNIFTTMFSRIIVTDMVPQGSIYFIPDIEELRDKEGNPISMVDALLDPDIVRQCGLINNIDFDMLVEEGDTALYGIPVVRKD